MHKKTSIKIARSYNPLLGTWKSVSFIIFFLVIIFYNLVLPKYSSSCQGLL